MRSYEDIAKEALETYKQIWDSLSAVRQKRVIWQHQQLVKDLKSLIEYGKIQNEEEK